MGFSELTRQKAGIEKEIAVVNERLKMAPLNEQQYGTLQAEVSMAKANYAEAERNSTKSQTARNVSEHKGGEMLGVLDAANVPDKELADAKFRVAGQLLMSMQTVEQQAAQRVAGILNGYPIDYYDKYAERISQVTADEVKTVMNKYVQEDHLVIVVVAPAAAVKTQLEKLGPVEVLPMPSTE